jgi:heme oxygenase
MLHETLKKATQKNHDELEELMFVNDVMSGSLTLQQYKQILNTNYQVHKTVEDFLFNDLSPKTAEKLDLEHRKKLTALVADMQEALLPVVTADNDYTALDLENNDATILGAMYVLEGATLGGNVIVKRLKVNPNLAGLNLNFNYYQVYGDQLVNYWKAFCSVLDAQPEDTFDKSIEGATKIFDYIAAVQQKNNQLV